MCISSWVYVLLGLGVLPDTTCEESHIYLCWTRCWARNVVYMCISSWVYVLLSLGVSSWREVWRVPHMCVEQDVERGVWYSPTAAHYIHQLLQMLFTNQHTYTRHLTTSRNLPKDTSRLLTTSRNLRNTRLYVSGRLACAESLDVSSWVWHLYTCLPESWTRLDVSSWV